MANTISPNMGLIVPGVGTEPGPDWANDLNADLGVLDQHNHSAGSGVPINTNGININTDFSINGFNLTTVKTVNFLAQIAPLSGIAPNLGAIYVAGNELYYNDEVGNVVQITNLGSVNAGAGSITGLPSGTASASYSSGTQTFVWQSATSTPANMDGGSFIFRDIVANSKGVTLSAPPALAADYQMFWPTGLPGSNSFLALDASGNISTGPAVTGGLTDTNISSKSLTNASIANQTITQPLLAPRPAASTAAVGGIAVSASSGAFATASTTPVPVTNLAVTITTTGRPVMVMLNSDGSSDSVISSSSGSGAAMSITAVVGILNGVTSIYSTELVLGADGGGGAISFQHACSSVSHLDLSVNGVPGTYTYSIVLNRTGGDNSVAAAINDTILVAYEI